MIRCSCGATSYCRRDNNVRWRWNNSPCCITILVNLCPSNSIILPWNIRLSSPIQSVLHFSNIDFKDYKFAFSELYTSNAKVLNRMRLTCQSKQSLSLYNSNNNGNLSSEDFTSAEEPVIHAMNEVILHRGRSPHLTMLNIYIDGVFLTEAIVPT